MPPGLQKTIASPTGPHGPVLIGACWSLQPDPLAPPAPAMLQFAAAPRFIAVRASRIWGFRPQPLYICAWFISGTFFSLPSAKSVPCPSCSSSSQKMSPFQHHRLACCVPPHSEPQSRGGCTAHADGVPAEGQGLVFRVKSNGCSR